MFNSPGDQKKLKGIRKTFLNKEVRLKCGKDSMFGKLVFCGVSPIAEKFNGEYYTFTIDRTAYRVNELKNVKLELI